MFLVVSAALEQDSYSAEEGGIVEVCAVIRDVPAGGLECPVVATLSAADGQKLVSAGGFDFYSAAPKPFIHVCIPLCRKFKGANACLSPVM